MLTDPGAYRVASLSYIKNGTMSTTNEINTMSSVTSKMAKNGEDTGSARVIKDGTRVSRRTNLASRALTSKKAERPEWPKSSQAKHTTDTAADKGPCDALHAPGREDSLTCVPEIGVGGGSCCPSQDLGVDDAAVHVWSML